MAFQFQKLKWCIYGVHGLLACAGFSRSRVIFIIFIIYNTEMLLLLLSRGYREPRPFLLLILPCWQGSWRYLESWEERQPEQVTQTDKTDILDHITSCLVYKVEGRRRKGKTFAVMVFVLLNDCSMGWGPVLLEMAELFPAHWKH